MPVITRTRMPSFWSWRAKAMRRTLGAPDSGAKVLSKNQDIPHSHTFIRSPATVCSIQHELQINTLLSQSCDGDASELQPLCTPTAIPSQDTSKVSCANRVQACAGFDSARS